MFVDIEGEATVMVTREQLAKMLQISTSTLRRLERLGQCPQPIRIGRQLRWNRETIRRWIENPG